MRRCRVNTDSAIKRVGRPTGATGPVLPAPGRDYGVSGNGTCSRSNATIAGADSGIRCR
jgi:hypothetical protein